jgi:hypothetical protein
MQIKDCKANQIVRIAFLDGHSEFLVVNERVVAGYISAVNLTSHQFASISQNQEVEFLADLKTLFDERKNLADFCRNQFETVLESVG